MPIMLRLYQPCLPTRVMKAPTGEQWVHEIKHDGFRIIARKVGGVVRLQTKQGYDYAERYPLIVEAIGRLKVSSIVLDGEAVCFSGVAHDFDKLWNRTHDHEAKLCAFDLLELDGEDFRAKPLLEEPVQTCEAERRARIRRAPAMVIRYSNTPVSLDWRASSASGLICLTVLVRQRAG